jgi:hypothetical protein
MTITFHHPPTGTVNPLIDFEPWNEKHYPETKGIYINGIRLKINGIMKFVPVYVGIAFDDSLRNRLFNHHYKKYKTCGKGVGKGNKDIWNFSSVTDLSELLQVYVEMYHYDNINNYNHKAVRTSEEYLRALLTLNYLLFYQNRNYFVMKAGGAFTNLGRSERELNHCDAIGEGFDLDGQIQRIKAVYDTDFYFVFCPIEDILPQLEEKGNKELFANYISMSAQLERIERATKRALNIIGIHTTAKAEGEFLDMNIDLTNIQEDLVNLGGHPYNSEGHYSKLIIPIRK